MVKSGDITKPEWLNDLRMANRIDESALDVLSYKTTVRFFIRHDELALPADWQHENPDLAKNIADQLRVLLPQGLSLEDLNAVKVGIAELASFLDMVVERSNFDQIRSNG